MLRISFVEALDETVTIQLEGQVRGPWVEELRRSCEQLLATGSGLILDLTEVSFIDTDGVALCRSLRERNVPFLHCSPFVAEQLKGWGL
jgi:anti-anti-sigma regulatory factor